MGKRGPKPKGKVKIKWSPNFAYGIGLLASDGNLSPDGRHINFTSKEKELILHFQKAFRINVRIGRKSRAKSRIKEYFVAQFSDVLFYEFLLSIGLTPNKSKTIADIKIPPKLFFNFLRGSFDGDGSTYSYWDPRWKSSFMFYTVFISASRAHIAWIRECIREQLHISGHITGTGRAGTIYQLKYAKAESRILLKKMYPSRTKLFLKRKKLKIDTMLRIIHQRRGLKKP